MKKVFNKNEVRIKARKLIRKGMTKQDCFNTLMKEYNNAKVLADIIKYIPSNTAKFKYGLWNFLLLALLASCTFIWIYEYYINFFRLPIFAILSFILAIFIVAVQKYKYYIYISIISVKWIIIFIVLGIIEKYNIKDIIENELFLILYMVLLVPIVILSIVLPKKLSPNPKKTRILKKNKKGKEVLVTEYVFQE